MRKPRPNRPVIWEELLTAGPVLVFALVIFILAIKSCA